MAYRRAPYTEGGDLTEYLQRELENIENEFNRIAGGFAFTLLKAAPPKPRLGQVVLADGANWSPLGVSTPHLSLFNGSTWESSTADSALQSFTPVVTFATPGDLSIAYTTQIGRTSRIGKLVVLNFAVAFTPTFTSSSGHLLVQGFPWAPVVFTTGVGQIVGTGVTWPAGRTMFHSIINGANIEGRFSGSAVGVSALAASNIASGVSCVFSGTLAYLTDI